VGRESNRVEGNKGRRISMKIVVMTHLRREVAARRTKKQIKVTLRALLNRRKR
jgi:hypothetical protein